MKSSVTPAGDAHAVDQLGGLAVGEFGPVGHVGGGFLDGARGVDDGDGVFVAGDQHAVLGAHQVGLDVVGALFDGQPVGGQGVLRHVAGGAALGDQQGLGGCGLVGAVVSRLGGGGGGVGAQGADEHLWGLLGVLGSNECLT